MVHENLDVDAVDCLSSASSSRLPIRLSWSWFSVVLDGASDDDLVLQKLLSDRKPHGLVAVQVIDLIQSLLSKFRQNNSIHNTLRRMLLLLPSKAFTVAEFSINTRIMTIITTMRMIKAPTSMMGMMVNGPTLPVWRTCATAPGVAAVAAAAVACTGTQNSDTVMSRRQQPRGREVTRSTSRLHFSVSAYSGVPSDGRSGTEVLPLPLRARLPSPSPSSSSSSSQTATTWLVEIDVFRTDDEIEQGRQLMNYVIEEGKSWPFVEIFETTETFKGYFLSHAAFCVRPISNPDDNDNDDGDKILGCFYIKPNFPGRCSHICNGGFIVNASQRGSKVGSLMGSTFLPFAKALGYKSSYFNLVFASNTFSIRLWENLGMERVATIPNAARLVGMPVVDPTTNETQLDTAYGYYYDLETLPDGYDPLRHPNLMDFTP
jgi:RimJ/RimL family protein N-acetyltransferase